MMSNEISAIVGNVNPRYKGLHKTSACRFIEFLMKRNAGALAVSEFRSFRFSGQMALRDGLIFNENQILSRNEFFDADKISAYIVIGCRLNYDLILLDLGLPDMDGMEIIRSVREWSSIPIVVLSARYAETEKVKALAAKLINEGNLIEIGMRPDKAAEAE